MWYHLSKIEYFYTHDTSLLNVKNKELWSYIWGNLFQLFHIEDVLLRAKIVHVIQTLVSFFVIFFTSKVFIQNIFKKIDMLIVNYLALWSTIIWFTIFATFSVAYHQVWIMWYSINYQITLLIFWYLVAISILFVTRNNSKKISIFYIVQILFFSIIILWMHAIEFIYYIMYLILICIVYWRQLVWGLKQYYVQITIAALSLFSAFYYFLTHHFIYREPKLFKYLSLDVGQLYSKIVSIGKYQVENLSRSFASLNELIYFSIFLILAMVLTKAYFYYKEADDNVDIKMLILIFISSLFVFVPVINFTFGLASMLVDVWYVNRFYYASSIFIVLPIVVYYFIQLTTHKQILLKTNIIILLILLTVYFYSKHISQSSNYYKNIISIINSFSKEKVGLNYSTDYINIIDNELTKYEKKYQNQKVLYYARGDIAYILQYILKKDNVYMNRRHTYTYEEFLQYCKHHNVVPVVFKTPENFPKDELIFKYFDFDMK